MVATGEALNIDLGDFITELYRILLPLSLVPDVDIATTPPSHSAARDDASATVGDMLFRALNLAFSPRVVGSAAPSWRAAAFSKRLLAASLHWPPSIVLQTLEFVRTLIGRDSKLEGLLSTEDRTFNGVYRPDLDDPQLSNPFGTSFWELNTLADNHWHTGVRGEAEKLRSFIRS